MKNMIKNIDFKVELWLLEMGEGGEGDWIRSVHTNVHLNMPS
jgi:hypothetical protein